jgi:hypothetical protein
VSELKHVHFLTVLGALLWPVDKNASLSSALEAFDKDLFSHGVASAYPPDRLHAIFPSALALGWSDASLDDTMALALRQISDTIHDVALADGQSVSYAAKYPNYAFLAQHKRIRMVGMSRGSTTSERRLIRKV